MIGGIDIEIPTRCGDASIEVAVRAIRQRWPHAEFENGLTGDRYHRFWQIPFGDLSEIFVYRDSSSADRWDKDGAIPAVYNTMIHVLGDEVLLTIVVDECDGLMEEIVATITSALADQILYVPAELVAA